MEHSSPKAHSINDTDTGIQSAEQSVKKRAREKSEDLERVLFDGDTELVTSKDDRYPCC